MANREQINIRIDPELKRSWEEYVSESPIHESITGLIRVAVANEINDSDSQSSHGEGNDPRIGEILDAVRHLGTNVEDLETRMRSIEREVERRPDLMELATKIFDRLPTVKPGGEDWEAKVAQWGPEKHTVWPATVEALAKATGEEERMIKKSLEHLQSRTHALRNTEIKGEIRWWRAE